MRTCTFLECGRTSRYADGLCDSHHRQRRGGKPLTPIQHRSPAVSTDGLCTFAECEKPRATNGLCAGHYAQRMRGEPLTPIRTAPGQSEARYWSNVDKTGECWVWKGRVINSGYGACSVNGKKWLAHRYSYTMARGAIADGHVIDHICRNKICVKPSHLRQVSQLENVRSQGLRTNNTSGVRGVTWDKARQRWVASVNIGGKKRFVGRFTTIEDAAQAVAAARATLYADPSHP